MNASTNGRKQIAVERQASRWSGTALENSGGEIAGLRIQIRRIFAHAISLSAMAAYTIAAVQQVATARVTTQAVDVALLNG